MTLDGGNSWDRFMNGLPPVAVHDLVIHPRDFDLVAGTHGRSIWIADDITPLQQLSDEVLGSDVHLFENRVGTKWLNFSKGRIQSYFKFRGGNPPRGAPISFYLRSEPQDSVKIEIEDPIAGRVRTLYTRAHAGINRARWNMEFLPNEHEIEEHRTFLAQILETITEAIQGTRRIDLLEQMQKDLLAVQRFPNLYDNTDYSDTGDARRLLLEHLRHIATRLADAQSVRQLYSIREQLLAFSQIVGDQAFFGFYGDELTTIAAPAGQYRVILTVDGQSHTGTVSVREDPIKQASMHR